MMKKLILIALLFIIPSISSADFSGDYAIGNWTEGVNAPTGTLWDISGVPDTVILKNYSPWAASEDQMAIVATADGTVTFSWSYSIDTGTATMFPAGYMVDGVKTQVSDNAGVTNQSGNASFSVISGENFGFYNGLTNQNTFGTLEFAITDFTFTPADSIPTLSEWGMIIFSILLGTAAICSMRRKKENLI